jgi:hypothetical protein
MAHDAQPIRLGRMPSMHRPRHERHRRNSRLVTLSVLTLVGVTGNDFDSIITLLKRRHGKLNGHLFTQIGKGPAGHLQCIRPSIIDASPTERAGCRWEPERQGGYVIVTQELQQPHFDVYGLLGYHVIEFNNCPQGIHVGRHVQRYYRFKITLSPASFHADPADCRFRIDGVEYIDTLASHGRDISLQIRQPYLKHIFTRLDCNATSTGNEVEFLRLIVIVGLYTVPPDVVVDNFTATPVPGMLNW